MPNEDNRAAHHANGDPMAVAEQAAVAELLADIAAVVFRVGRFLLVPLTELEPKVPDLWESIKAAESFRRALDDA